MVSVDIKIEDLLDNVAISDVVDYYEVEDLIEELSSRDEWVDCAMKHVVTEDVTGHFHLKDLLEPFWDLTIGEAGEQEMLNELKAFIKKKEG